MIEHAEQEIMQYIKQGDNCCEAILKTADNLWELNLNEQVHYAAKFFKSGMQSGSTCGALVGIMMASGILAQTKNITLSGDFPKQLFKRFVEENGSSCCRVLRKDQGLRERMTNKGCCNITQKAMKVLIEAWETGNG